MIRRALVIFAALSASSVDAQVSVSGPEPALEMPAVELKPGEFRRLPDSQVAEGSDRAETKVLVGLFGSVELPFVVRKIGTAWRVEPQPYFVLIES